MNDLNTIFQTASNHLQFAKQHTFAGNHAQANDQLKTMKQYINGLQELVRADADTIGITYARFQYNADKETYTVSVDNGETFQAIGTVEKAEEMETLLNKHGYKFGKDARPFAIKSSAPKREAYRNVFQLKTSHS